MNKIHTLLILMFFLSQKVISKNLKKTIDINSSNIFNSDSVEIDCKNLCINTNIEKSKNLNQLTLKNSTIEDPNKLFFNSFKTLFLQGNTQINLKNSLKINQLEKKIDISGNLNIKGQHKTKLHLGSNASIELHAESNLKIKNLNIVIDSPEIKIDPTSTITISNCNIEINSIKDLEILLSGNWIFKNKVKIKNNFETSKTINFSSELSSCNIFKNTIVSIDKQVNIGLQGNPESFNINPDSILELRGCQINFDLKEKTIESYIRVEKNSKIKTSGKVIFKNDYNLIVEDKNLLLEGIFVFE